MISVSRGSHAFYGAGLIFAAQVHACYNIHMHDDGTFRVISTIFISVCAGVITGVFVLTVLRFLDFRITAAGTLFAVTALCALTACFDYFEKQNLNVIAIEASALVLSALLCLLYIRVSALNETAAHTMLKAAAVLYGLTVPAAALRLYLKYGRRDI